MSNLIFNLRILYWHIQIERHPLRGAIRFNTFLWHRGLKGQWVELL
jgi:hypothetical protein